MNLKFSLKIVLSLVALTVSFTGLRGECAKPAFYEEIFTRKPKSQVYPNDLYESAVQAYEKGEWTNVVRYFRTLALYFPTVPCAKNAWFYVGVAYVEMDEFEKACMTFDTYLETAGAEFFDTVIEYKYYIANQFAQGLRKRPFGLKKIPRFAPSSDYALELYDNIIQIAPASELAARSIFAKGCLLRNCREFHEAVEAFSTLQRRFPKHELIPECYLMQLSVYHDLSILEFQNPDVIAFAELTYDKFKQEFPREEKLEEAEGTLASIKEAYARGFYETGCFYERTGRPLAAAIYYQTTMDRFPTTRVAELSQERLASLSVTLPTLQVKNKKVDEPFEEFELNSLDEDELQSS